jgi:hypothetical protein
MNNKLCADVDDSEVQFLKLFRATRFVVDISSMYHNFVFLLQRAFYLVCQVLFDFVCVSALYCAPFE